MSFESVSEFLSKEGFQDRILTFDSSTATVSEAAACIGCSPAEIAKTMAFRLKSGSAVLIVAAGDARIANPLFKGVFGEKPVMIGFDEVEELTGHRPGGVCPFAAKEGVRIFLDSSLMRFETVYPAAGNDRSGVRLSVDELKTLSRPENIVTVCKIPEINRD